MLSCGFGSPQRNRPGVSRACRGIFSAQARRVCDYQLKRGPTVYSLSPSRFIFSSPFRPQFWFSLT